MCLPKQGVGELSAPRRKIVVTKTRCFPAPCQGQTILQALVEADTVRDAPSTSPLPPHSQFQQHFATQMADSSDKAQEIIDAALLRHPEGRSLNKIDIAHARTIITFVFSGDGSDKYGDKQKRGAFQQLDSATLVYHIATPLTRT